MDKKVVVYTSSNCHNCKEIKELLMEKNFVIEEKNISEKQYRAELLRMGIGSVPVLVHEGNTIKNIDGEGIKAYIEAL